MMATVWGLLLILAMGGELSQSMSLSIDPNHRFAWTENCGWVSWRGVDGGAGGVQVASSHLSGWIWGENIGWISLGNGAPLDGVWYGNVTSGEYGVNIDGDADLFGMAWSENAGWINFDTRSVGAARARLDCAEQRLYGFVWGENIGWLNLNDVTHFVSGDWADACPAVFGDFDRDGDVDLRDEEVFADCIGGPELLPEPTYPQLGTEDCLRVFDSDVDSDVDLQDFSAFSRVYTGPNDPYVNAGVLRNSIASAGSYFSSGNDLRGFVAQNGFSVAEFSIEWTVESRPAGSGALTIFDPTQLVSQYVVSAPAAAGAYVFRLNATNSATMESASDTVTLYLVAQQSP